MADPGLMGVGSRFYSQLNNPTVAPMAPNTNPTSVVTDPSGMMYLAGQVPPSAIPQPTPSMPPGKNAGGGENLDQAIFGRQGYAAALAKGGGIFGLGASAPPKSFLQQYLDQQNQDLIDTRAIRAKMPAINAYNQASANYVNPQQAVDTAMQPLMQQDQQFGQQEQQLLGQSANVPGISPQAVSAYAKLGQEAAQYFGTPQHPNGTMEQYVANGMKYGLANTLAEARRSQLIWQGNTTGLFNQKSNGQYMNVSDPAIQRLLGQILAGGGIIPAAGATGTSTPGGSTAASSGTGVSGG